MTQAELARQLGLSSHSHVAKVEADEDMASLSFIIHAAELLNVSTDYLLRDTIPVDGSTESPFTASSDDRAVLFGARLRALRLQHQLSQRDLAHRLGLASRAYIGGLEADRGKLPSLELVVRIADLFGIRTDDLLRGAIPPLTSGSDAGKA